VKHRQIVFVAVLFLYVAADAFAQRQAPAIASSDVLSQISMFNYEEGPRSTLLLRSTPIAGNASGTAEVEYEGGNARISAAAYDLPAAATLGPYTTYILWALTPDGRASNQGVLGDEGGGNGELEASYGASQFALIVTAEPHFAVSAPSTMIMLYNVADDVRATESKVTTLVERADHSRLTPIEINDDNPVELVQAMYSVAIARTAGAERFAPQGYALAQQKLAEAQAAATGNRRAREASRNSSREAVLAGEDAYRATLVAAAEAEREAALAAERRRAEAALEAERERAETEATAARERADAEAAAARQRAEEASALAAGEAAQAAALAAAAAARADLRARLDAALPTRETDTGLVSEIGGVLFATGKADLSPAAREALARFSGIVASYPDLDFNIEGHTDSTGSAATNTELSLRRAITVRDYLIGQGVPASRIDVDGFGPDRPVADNSTPDGRARNRRVEIALSGGPLDAAPN
jgi:outer membrane protein OmpA-like peptidoglycan-associated protein